MARPQTLIVIRSLLLANGVLLTVAGAGFALFASGPGRWIASIVLWAVAGALFVGMRWTEPYVRDL
jgi:hypothetical protein